MGRPLSGSFLFGGIVNGMKAKWIGLAAGVLGLSAGSLAQGLPVQIGIRGGGILAQDSELQQTSNGWFGAGFDLGIGSGLWPNTRTFFSFDFFSHEGDNVFIYNLNQRFYGAATPSGQRVYLIGGIGGASFDVEGDKDTVMGGRVGVGMEFTKNVYGEAVLYFSDRTDKRFRTNALGFYFGFRL